MTWIPCTERLPDKMAEVLCTAVTDYGETYLDIGYHTDEWTLPLSDEECREYTVLAWTPLPEPYEPK